MYVKVYREISETKLEWQINNELIPGRKLISTSVAVDPRGAEMSGEIVVVATFE